MKSKEDQIKELKEKVKILEEENRQDEEIAKLKEKAKKLDKSGIKGFLRQGVQNFKGNIGKLGKGMQKFQNNSQINETYNRLHKSFIGDRDVNFVPPGVR